MDSNNKKKKDVLGMPYGTANGRLKKKLLFYMAIELNRAICYRCSKHIENVDEFSIEHKIAWLNSDNPIDNFFNISNIAFSHLKCNIEHGAKLPKLYENKNAKNKARYLRIRNDEDRYANKLKRKKTAYHNRKIKAINDKWNELLVNSDNI